MISSGLCLFCLFIFQDLDFTKSSHSTWTIFSGGGQNGIPLYRDDDHLNDFGVEALLLELFEQWIIQL